MGKRICITGGIGAGKSVVSRILRLKGYPVYDCDSKAKELMEGNDFLRSHLVAILGQEAFKDGKIDRKFVADRIFSDEAIRGEVNRVVHAAVRDDYDKFARGNEGVTFVETAIPQTAGFVETLDEIWEVDAPEQLRIERVKVRNGLDEESIRRRIKTQRSEFDSLPAEKRKMILNDGETSLTERISSLLQKIEN